MQVQRRWGVAERRACRVIGQPRSSQRFVGRKRERDRALSDRLVALGVIPATGIGGSGRS